MLHTASMPFDVETDVLVVGYGYAGAVAAITAHDRGAKVTILEKMSQGGGNSLHSAGNCGVVRPNAASIFAKYLERLSFGTTHTELFQVYAQGSEELVEWVARLGGELVPRISVLANAFPGVVKGPAFPEVATTHDMFDFRVVDGPQEIPAARRMWNLLSDHVGRREIDVNLNSSAEELLVDEAGEVVGAIASIDGNRRVIRADRAVVMTCGGFENDPSLKNDYLASKPIKFAGNPGNTGDGVRMTQRIGADLWHMTRTATLIGYQAAEYDAAFCIFFQSAGFIYIDQHAKRYVDETSIELHDFDRVFSHFDPHKVEFPRIPSWGIFNEETRLAGPLTWSIAGYNREHYSWSADNQAEIDRGWIIKADKLSALSELLELPLQALENTIATYNQACANGQDTAFGRDGETLKTLQPPYYAIALHPVMVNTQGGSKRDVQARIVDPRGNPIRRLYSAGEFGSIWGYLYDGAGNVTECLVFGRIAGHNAAGESSRTATGSKDA